MMRFQTGLAFTLAACLAAMALTASAQELTDSQRAAHRRPQTIPFPKEKLYTTEKAALGKMLFFDTRLSRDKSLNCESGHNP